MLFITNCLSYLNKIIPKNKFQILFYDSLHNFLDDNTEAVYSYLKVHDTENKYNFVICENQKVKRISYMIIITAYGNTGKMVTV